MQVTHLHPQYRRLQKKFGHPTLEPIYGAGCINHPDLMLVFMNPTGKNVSADAAWHGLRAPWLGTKNIWKLLFRIHAISPARYLSTQTLKPKDWTPQFCQAVYEDLARQKIFITNLAKCTQRDARPLPNYVFQQYVDLLRQEISFVQPTRVVTFGNQVSSILLGRNISVGSYSGAKHGTVKIKNDVFPVYPTWYPVGQGMRNLPLAVKRLKLLR